MTGGPADKLTGSCLCGGVTYTATGPFRDVIACHCGQCRKTSGHHVAATQIAADGLEITAGETLTWFRSSDVAERGFCGRCGGNLFWRRFGDDKVSIFAGTLDPPTGLRMTRQIRTEEASDYYTPPGDLPTVEQTKIPPPD